MKLNLRDLFWLIFVAAVVTMWWMDRSKLADRLSFYETPKATMPPPPPVMPPPFNPSGPIPIPGLTDDPFAPAPISPADSKVPPQPKPLPADDPFAPPNAVK